MLKIITAITLMGIASAATAGTGSQGYFEIYNDTSSNTVVGF
jgi:hypothetical protein